MDAGRQVHPTGLDADSAAAPRQRRLLGLGVSAGIAHGPVVRLGDRLPVPAEVASTRTAQEELATLQRAITTVATDLRNRGRAATDSAVRDVLDAEALMAEDPLLHADATRRIERGSTAARAAWDAFAAYRDALASAGGYLAQRIPDLDDVRDRLVAHCLETVVPEIPDPGFPFVLVARALSPADTASLDVGRVLAIVTAEGGPTSHTAILARTLGIPAVVSCGDALSLADGDDVLIDGATGLVLTRPTALDLDARPVGLPDPKLARTPAGGRTADGVEISLLANVGNADDAAAAAAAGAAGIGLLRTEFLFLRADSPPSVEQQQSALQTVLAAFPERLVVVRLLDAGGDKPMPFLAASDEPNPALGVRGLRALRAHPEILETQLDAIAGAAAKSAARVAVMAPLVTDARDAEWFRDSVRSRAGWPPEIPIGVMVETPAAALTAGGVLAVSDFASIGTNDLAQYVMAADRSVGSLSNLQSPWHPAVLELIERTAVAGRRAGKPVGVCGEAAADPLLALVLVGLGITSLSMSWTAISGVRAMLARHAFADCVELARVAATAGDAELARARVRNQVGA